MKKIYFITFLISFYSLLCSESEIFAQQCDPTVPVFNVNLTGNPSGTWISPSIQRDGLCCSASGSDVCVEFVVILDTASSGISFSIATGAIPPGALYYQVNCGTPAPVGTVICLNGTGPHHLTFCKPGGNDNSFQIQSVPKASVGGTKWISQACTGLLVAYGLEDTSITWTSVPSNPVYNGYLSCTQGCDSSVVTFTGGSMPSSVLYQVCGTVIGGCAPVNFCDTIRVNFVSDLDVNITPKNPTICYGGSLATVTANPVGGKAPYTYSWSTGATTQSITVGAGTYIVQINDAMNCSTGYDTVTVNALASYITANAGPDQILCTGAQSTVALNGNIVAATGGIWMSGTGTFNPNDTTLNAVYTPSAAEASAGLAQLMLVTTGNSGCPADTDWVKINIAPQPVPTVAGAFSVCERSNAVYNASNPSAVTYLWAVSGGTFLSPNNSSSVIVQWNNAGSGSLTLTAANALCDTVITYPVTINPRPIPVISGPATACVPSVTTFSVANLANNTYSWTVSGGTIVGSTTGNSINVQWNNPGTGTVSVTQANSFSCDSTATVSVTLNPQPYPQVAGSSTVCAPVISNYMASCNVAVSYFWSVSGGTLLSPNNSSSVNVQWSSAGSGSITLTATHSSGCDSTIIYPVTINPEPIPVINGPASVCVPSTSTFSLANPGTNNHSWSVSGGTITGSTTGSSINVQWNNPGTATVSVTETNSFGCDSTVSVTVALNPQPYPSVTGNFIICEPTISSYTASCNVPVGYLWTVNGGTLLSANNGNIITVQWNNAGNGSISLTATHSSGCDSTVTYPVIINPKPTPVVNGPALLCVPATSTFSLANPGTNNHNWSVSGGTILGSSTGSSISVQWNSPGNGTVVVTETNSFGCDSTISVPVTLKPQPYPQVTGVFTLCQYSTSVYTASCNVPVGYQWSVSGGTLLSSSNGGTITVQWNNAGSGSITLTATHSGGCDSTISYPVIINPSPTPAISGPSAVCVPSTSTFYLQVPNGNNHSWTVLGGTILGSATGNSITVQWNNLGTASVSVLETNGSGCDSSVSKSVALNAFPTPSLSGNPKVCEQDTATYTVTYVPGNTYNWAVTGGSIVGFAIGNSIEVFWYGSGTGMVSVKESTPAGCDSTISQTIKINPKPAMSILGPHSLCSNQSAVYTCASNNIQYSWNVAGGYFSSGSNQSSQSSVTVQWNGSGNGSLMLMVTDSNGCINAAAIPVLVQPRPAPVITGTKTGCASAAYIGKYSVTTAAPGNYSYSWSSTGGIIANGNGTNNIAILWTKPGTFFITVKATSLSTGCDSSSTMLVQVDTMQRPVIAANNYNGCAPLGVSFNGNSINPDYTYLWTFGDGLSSSDPNPSHNYNHAGTFPVTLAVTNNTGCADTAYSQIHTFPSPTANFQSNLTVLDYYNTTPFTLDNHSTGANQYFWDFGNGDHATGFEPKYEYPEPGNYIITLIVTNTFGCRDTIQSPIEIKVPEDIFIPNAFTPNGDSRNDQFHVACKNVSDLKVSIFDRWGQEIYSSKDKDFHWDGTYRGSAVQGGVYVYRINATGNYGKPFEKVGTVTVVK